MIQANELRIGNYIDYEKTTHIVDGVKDNIVYSYWIKDLEQSDLYICENNIIDPIELTEEWLVKFGFLKHKENGRYGYKYYIPILDYNYVVERDFNEYQSHFFGIEYTDCPDPKDDYIFNSFSFDLKYIHQLQNLYFALTGKELKH